jgi:predicted MPP superfamily phosphohydrolase
MPLPKMEQTAPQPGRRRFLKQALSLLAGLASVGLMTDSFWVERRAIEVNKILIRSGRIPHPFKGMRLLHFSDIHFGFYCDLDQVERIVQLIEPLRPDLICFTGDLIDQDFTPAEALKISRLFNRLKAPLGKYAIPGNHDYLGDLALVKRCWEQAGFRFLINESAHIRKDGVTLVVSGLDDGLEGKPDLYRLLEQTPEKETFHILLAHEPDMADQAKDGPVDLQLSGHSHGGQIRLPFIGPILTPPLSKKYPAGLYQVGPITLYTNRGLGTTILPLRFLCRPELTLLEIV